MALMLKSTLKILPVLGLLWLCPILLKAQQPADTLGAEGKTLQEDTARFRPEGLRIGIDVSRLLNNVANPDSRYWEVNTDLSFGKYLLSADWGTGREYRFRAPQDYLVSGSYFRVGPDINFIPDNVDKNALFIGLRYARSSFREQLSSQVVAAGYDTLLVNFDRRSSAHWYEMVAGLKARVWNNFYMAYTLRYKLGLSIHSPENLTPYEVPGFGRRGDGNAFSFNYHLFYRIPFRRD